MCILQHDNICMLCTSHIIWYAVVPSVHSWALEYYSTRDWHLPIMSKQLASNQAWLLIPHCSYCWRSPNNQITNKMKAAIQQLLYKIKLNSWSTVLTYRPAPAAGWGGPSPTARRSLRKGSMPSAQYTQYIWHNTKHTTMHPIRSKERVRAVHGRAHAHRRE